MRALLICLSACLVLAGCGQKGPLVLPPEPAATANSEAVDDPQTEGNN